MRRSTYGLFIALAVVIGLAATLVFGQPKVQQTESVLVTGSFQCQVQVVDPPGPGVPQRGAFVNVTGALGVTVFQFVGAGDSDMENPTIEACDVLASEVSAIAEQGGCTVSEVSSGSVVGSNFTEENRSFAFFCHGASGHVVDNLARLMQTVMRD